MTYMIGSRAYGIHPDAMLEDADYEDAPVFETFDKAVEHLCQIPPELVAIIGPYNIFGVGADWEKDTKPSGDSDIRRLIGIPLLFLLDNWDYEKGCPKE